MTSDLHITEQEERAERCTADLRAVFNRMVELDLPIYCRSGILYWYAFGHDTGEFLRRLITGKPWWKVVIKADSYSKLVLAQWAALFRDLNIESWGSEEKRQYWWQIGGLVGEYELQELFDEFDTLVANLLMSEDDGNTQTRMNIRMVCDNQMTEPDDDQN